MHEEHDSSHRRLCLRLKASFRPWWLRYQVTPDVGGGSQILPGFGKPREIATQLSSCDYLEMEPSGKDIPTKLFLSSSVICKYVLLPMHLQGTWDPGKQMALRKH